MWYKDEGLHTDRTLSLSEGQWHFPSKNKRSKVWQHFLESQNDDLLVKCIHCGKEYKSTDHQTSGMIYHLNHAHNIRLGKFN